MNTASIDAALARNRYFAGAGGHEDVVMFPMTLFVITCIDPRVDPAYILGLELGDAIVVRNGGGRVTPETIETVAFIAQLGENLSPDGATFEVAVIHHTQCGTGFLADDDFRHRYAERIGTDEAALLDLAVVDPVATVVADVERLRAASAMFPGVQVSGYVYDVATGLVRTVFPASGATAPSTRSA
jgi:carbonic anhydrase